MNKSALVQPDFGRKRDMFLSFLFTALISHLARAEYRVFTLEITRRAPAAVGEASAPADAAAPQTRIIQSTLDPVQYVGYFPLEAGETIKYTQTWRCPGRTDGFLPLCPNPKAEKVNP